MGHECSRRIENPLLQALERKKPRDDGWCFARHDKFSFGRGNANCMTDCGLFVSPVLECVKIVWQVWSSKQLSCVVDLERQFH